MNKYKKQRIKHAIETFIILIILFICSILCGLVFQYWMKILGLEV